MQLANCKLGRTLMSLLETENAVQEAAARTGPAVIGLGRGARRGSGVLIGPNRAVTLARNLRAEEISVSLGGGTDALARVVGTDVEVDLAVLELDGSPVAADPVPW